MARQAITRERNAAHFPAFETEAPPEPTVLRAPFKALVKRLSEAYGPAGSEERVREVVRDEIKGFVDQVRVDALGNLIAHRKGSGAHRKKIMLAAHLDELGVIVTFLDARGFARFGALGPVRPLTLLGARVQFENGTTGVIGREGKNASRTEVDMESLFLDLGASSVETAPVQVGDAACFAGELLEEGDYLIGKALNDRAGCAILIETARQLKKSVHELYFVFTVQQKVGARGAGAAAFAIQPDLALVIDGTAASDMPGGAKNLALGNGPAIKFQDEGALTTANVRQRLLSTARELRIPHQIDVTPQGHGDSLPIQAAREGVPTGALGIPMRYLNTTSEMLHHQDAQNAVKLLLGVISKPS